MYSYRLCSSVESIYMPLLPPPPPPPPATDCLSYVRLKELISSSPALLHLAMQQVLGILRNEVSHSADPGEREVLLPLLHLFREFLVMVRGRVGGRGWITAVSL